MSAEQGGQKPCNDNGVTSGLQDVIVFCVSIAVVGIIALVALAVHS